MEFDSDSSGSEQTGSDQAGNFAEADPTYKVTFVVYYLSGFVKTHQADVRGNARIIDLKYELAHELLDPQKSIWTISRTQKEMGDENYINRDYSDLMENEMILVFPKVI